MAKRIEIKKDQRFGMLTIISEGETLILPSGQTNRTALCQCDCGNTTTVRLLHLTRGRIRSCGCLGGEQHRERGTKLYKRWCAIKSRCNENYRLQRYEKLNVKICPEWKNSYISFRDWALANGYKDGLQIDRIDNNKGYSPDNCRFVTNQVNVNNRSNTFMIFYNGEKVPFMNLIYEKGLILHVAAIRGRIKRGWSDNRAIDTPIWAGNYKRNTFNKEDALKKLGCKDMSLVEPNRT